jgi:hypothetical protein
MAEQTVPLVRCFDYQVPPADQGLTVGAVIVLTGRRTGKFRVTNVIRLPRVTYPGLGTVDNFSVRIRKVGHTKKGHRFGETCLFWKDRYRLIAECDGTAAGAFADFLEERGYDEAADLLRTSFVPGWGVEVGENH